MHGNVFCFSGSDRCPVRSFVKYVRCLNPKAVSLFQKARTSPINGMYYNNASVSHNKLRTFMTEKSRMAKLSREYTNHRPYDLPHTITHFMFLTFYQLLSIILVKI